MATRKTKPIPAVEETKVEETKTVAQDDNSAIVEAENKKLKTDNKKLKQTVESMNAELAELKKMIASISENASTATSTTSAISTDEEVLVCSLCVGALSVGTEKHGRGTIYEFGEFGEEQEIPFGDLRDIVRNNRSFADGCAFYVLDEGVAKKLRLVSAYKNAINADEMRNIMSSDANTFVKLYDKATNLQKENIISLITDAKAKGQFVDANILNQIGQRSNRDLMNLE
jgi:cell division septum initiation protein DivIVA